MVGMDIKLLGIAAVSVLLLSKKVGANNLGIDTTAPFITTSATTNPATTATKDSVYYWGVFTPPWYGGDPLAYGLNLQEFPSQYVKDIAAGLIQPLTEEGAAAFIKMFGQPTGGWNYNLYAQNLF